MNEIKNQQQNNLAALNLGELPEYRIVLTDLELSVDKIKMSPKILKKHEARFLNRNRAIYPFCKTVIKTKQIPAGEHYAKFDNVFTNELPNSAIAVMVNSSAFGGSIRENPYLFDHFHTNYFSFKVNSEVIPPGGIHPVFKGRLRRITEDDAEEKLNAIEQDKSQIRKLYRRLFDHTGIGTGNVANNITPTQFQNGCTIFAHDFTPDRCLGFHDHETSSGTMDVEVKFDKPLEKGITIIVLGSFDDQLMLDADRNVVYE